nr:heat shock 70 kDa protein 12A-like isoform X3 [Crassostrea virginica]XP_022286222.1 heat shock 70 kDa protein 12A-like isoform X3 [Crassostrea virginica]
MEMTKKRDSESDITSQEIPEEDWKKYYYFSRFKMLLYENEAVHDETEMNDITGKVMKALDVFSICIMHLKENLLTKMNKRFAVDVSEKDVQYVLTVPGIWGNAAKMFMRKAAAQAGIETDQITLALEPHAASFYCQYSYEAFDNMVKNGGTFMVVDLGGGTVDITVQKQNDDGTLKEILPVTGGPEGGTSVDRAFHLFLESILGKGILEEFKNKNVEDYLIFMREFEFKKRSSCHPLIRKIWIHIPLEFEKLVEEFNGINISKAFQKSQCHGIVSYKKNKLYFERSKFKEFFKEAVDGVVRHINGILSEHVCSDLEDIIMVGGFSECELIQNDLREEFKAQHFRIPANPGLAVLNGAVYFGHLTGVLATVQKKQEWIKSKCRRFCVAGIDFGTTFSGYAFSLTFEWRSVHHIVHNSQRFVLSKCPSILLLKPDKSFLAFGYEARNIYMNLREDSTSDSDSSDSDSQEETECIAKEEWRNYYYFHDFKMLLLNKNKIHRDLEIEDITGKPMKALDLFSISINYIKQKLLKEINAKVAINICDNHIDFVLTVPAILGDSGKLFMQEAAIQAGIKKDQLTLVLESEAASIYCQYYASIQDEEQQLNPSDEFRTLVENKEKYMVLDIGGMVDVAVHKQNERGIIEEILPITGGPFGGISVDRAFEDFLESIFGREILDIFQNSYFEDFQLLFNEFEAKKRDCTHIKVRIAIALALERLLEEKSGIRLSSTLKQSQYKERVTFKGKRLIFEHSISKSFFQPAIDGIIKTIQNVLSNQQCVDLKHICMVGGFSESKIIQKILKETFPKCHFLIPDEPGLAVLKGAVYFGHLPNAVSGRFARFTYGVKICRRFRPGEDQQSKGIVVDEELLCHDIFFPIVRLGDEIQTGIGYSYKSKTFKQHQQKLCVTVFVSCDREPKYIDDEGCRALGSLTINILKDSEKYIEIEQTIIFGESNLIFRAKQCGSNICVETSIDMLDEANVPEFLNI